MSPPERTLAMRLGKSVHVSPLRYKLSDLRAKHPSPGSRSVEDWLVDVANVRGARVVERPRESGWVFEPPPPAELSDEELVVAICGLQCLDRPQMLRLAAQLVSRGELDPGRLCLIAERERAGEVLSALAGEALRVDPSHRLWCRISERFPRRKPLSSALLHWTRLAEPVMKGGRCNAESWRLVA